MKNFLRLISFFLIVKIITSYNCFENNINYCTCNDLDNGIIQYSCIDPMEMKNSINLRHFEISIGTFETTIKCINSASLENFHYDFRFLKTDLTTIVLDNCNINRKTDISKIKELTATEYVSKINLVNNSQLNNILIQNPSYELYSLLRLNIMDDNNLKLVNIKLFHNVPNIYYLTIKRCFVQTITPNAFINLKQLIKLNLSQNKLKNIPSEIFNSLHELTDLDLSGNQLEILDDKIFQNLQVLKNLNLEKNKLTTISEFLLDKLYSLEEFNAAENLISTIHKNAFIKLLKLERINLRKNNITDLTSMNEKTMTNIAVFWNNYSVFTLCHNLKELDLSYNNIQQFYDDWIELTELKLNSLKLSHNQIPFFKLSEKNLNMKSDFHINLTSNMIKGINLFSLSSLEFKTPFKMYIDARDNPIICDCLNDKLLQYIKGNIESKIYEHLNIDTTNLICNGPEEHEGKMLSALSMHDLSCEVNVKIDNIKESCTPKYYIEKMLTIINCANNDYSLVPEHLGIIVSFSNEINLENNNFEYIPEFSIAEQKSITKLNLSGNKIKGISGIELFENLQVLELKNNEISNLRNNDIWIFKSLKNLKHITLSGNPFICDSNFNVLKNYIKIEDRNNLTCHDEPLKTIEEGKQIIYSEYAKLSLCHQDREEVEQIWENTCSIKAKNKVL
ncbi:protein toll-like [Leptopilina boulardi]|uniref:protein toll-like n=1 Tax=Leptopilina boulardi TaxID=63433 RepID=UPI0021F67C80|nr:protein toll-like [Leptopilina boulardi]